MILGQLIQAGRHFCECRSEDFIPKSEDQSVVVAYTVGDYFVARSFDAFEREMPMQVRRWLQSSAAVAYLLIARHAKNLQEELPAPIGRTQMDRITITAATPDARLAVTYLVERLEQHHACRLIKANPAPTLNPLARGNLFQQREDELTSDISFDRTESLLSW